LSKNQDLISYYFLKCLATTKPLVFYLF